MYRYHLIKHAYIYIYALSKHLLYMQATLVMAYERSKSTLNNFGKLIHQFQTKMKTIIGKFERILIKSYRKNMPFLLNQLYLNERLLSSTHRHTDTDTQTYTHTHTHTDIYIYIDIFMALS